MNDKPHYVSALDVEEWATKCINLERERDEARGEISSIRNALSQNGEAVGNGEHHFLIIEMVENLMQSKDYFVRKSDSLEQERNEAREDLSAMVDIAFKHLTSLLRGAEGEEETQKVIAALKLWKEMNQ